MTSKQVANMNLFKSEWTFTRGLTLDLLDSLTDAELGQTPDPGLGPFWKQFRHVGRLQECYQEALNTKKIRFDYGNKRYRGGCSKNALRAYLRALDRELVQVVERVDWNATIEWEGEMASRLSALDAHACSRDSPSRTVDPLYAAYGKKPASRLESMGSLAERLKDARRSLYAHGAST